MPQLRTFVERVDFLFKRGGCMAVESSFTQHCLTLLSTGQLQVLEQGTYQVLPSPSDQKVQKCILRMSKWADMAKAVVEAEFPDFLVVTAFSVFALADEEKAVAEVAVNQTHCQRLAKLLSVDAQALACQIARHRPTSQANANITQCNKQEAWPKTLQKEHKDTSQRWAYVGLLATCGDEVPRLVLQHRKWRATFQRWRQAGC